MGELVAWIIGWDLILEYGVSVAAVAVGWGEYFNELLDSAFGFTLPESIAGPPGEGGVVNLPAVFIVLAVAALLIAGVRESARANTVMVVIKISILVLFIVLGVTAFNARQLHAVRAARGPSGDRERGVADLLRLHRVRRRSPRPARRRRTRRRDLPIAIIGSLAIATVLYIARRARGDRARCPYEQLDGAEAPLADALSEGAGFTWGAIVHRRSARCRDHERRADDALRPDADHVRDVPRRARPRAGSPTCTRDPHADLHHGRLRGS